MLKNFINKVEPIKCCKEPEREEKRERMKFSKVTGLCREIKHLIDFSEEEEFPIDLELDQGMEYERFTLRIDKVEKHEYTDRNGNKWVRVDE